MSKTTKSAAKPSADEVVKKAVGDQPGATAEGVASAAATAGEPASKDSRPKASEVAVGQPSEVTKPTATKDTTPKTSESAKGEASASTKPKAPDDRLKPGQLDSLVLAYLKENAGSAPHGPTTVAKALDRSSGAVGNCLVRLTKAKQVRQESDKPRRYSLAA